MTTDLRYPIGDFSFAGPTTPDDRRGWIDAIAACPEQVRAAVRGLDETQLDTPYRPGGWTVRQVVHHLPDSHVNAYVRSKLALTEQHPTIRPYEEALWAELPDSKGPIEVSLELLDRLHRRWVGLLRALPAETFTRTLFHPGSQTVFSLDRLIAMYAWHGRHHTAHITNLRARQGW